MARSATSLVKHAETKIDPVVEQYNGVAQHTGEVMVHVRELVDDNKQDVHGTIRNLNQASATVREKLPNLLEQATTVLTKAPQIVTSLQEFTSLLNEKAGVKPAAEAK